MKNKCLYCGATDSTLMRGLCVSRCYQTAIRLIKSGKTTWDKLVSNKKALKTRNHGNKNNDAIKWFLES